MSDMHGWQPDPFGRHEMRYFARGEPTEFVRDADSYSSDQLLAADSGESPAVASTPLRSHRHRRRHKTGSRLVVTAAVFVVLVGAGLGAALLATGSPPKPREPSAIVTSACATTLEQRTADMSISETVFILGHKAVLTGTGQINFVDNSGQMTVAGTIAGAPLSLRVRLLGNEFFLEESLSGHNLFGPMGGRTWLEVPIALASVSGAAGSPLNELDSLAQAGNAIRALGSSVVDGDRLFGYSVTLSRSELSRGAQQEIASWDLPPDAARAIEGQIERSLSAVRAEMDVWIDDHNTVRDVAQRITGLADGGRVEASVLYRHYGAAVSLVRSPPANEVLGLGSYLREALASENATE